jgi:hypothetical protein
MLKIAGRRCTASKNLPKYKNSAMHSHRKDTLFLSLFQRNFQAEPEEHCSA